MNPPTQGRRCSLRACCAEDPAFWEAREDASFETLMRIKHVQAINPIKFDKRDRRGWVVLQSAPQELKLEMA